MSKVNKKTAVKSLLFKLIDRAKAEPTQHGAKRFTVSKNIWKQLTDKLGKGLDLMGLWADHDQVHMALHDSQSHAIAIASYKLVKGKFPSVGAYHAPAILAERIIQDLYGIKAEGLPDERPWLDHGKWPLTYPAAKKPAASHEAEPYPFLGAEGEGIHQIPVGPVHASAIEPGHFRFFCAGETVVRLEARLGYTHKGIEKLLEGKTPQQAAPVCARVSGDSTVAYSIAFSRAVESALSVNIPARSHWIRALMGELERLSHHLGDIGAVCNDAAFALMHAHFGILREDVLRASKLCFGHRLMMDCVVPGGVDCDLDDAGAETLKKLITSLRDRLTRLVDLYDNTASLLDRTRNTGTLHEDLAAKFAAGGFVGRASGRDFDSRRDCAYEPYDSLSFDVPLRQNGDVDSRIWIRIDEVEQSLRLCEQIIHSMPEGKIKNERMKKADGLTEGMALVEGFRGDILVWVRLDGEGKISRCYLRDPSQFQWPLLEAVIENNIVADFPLCNKSFNCSYSGSDL